MATAILTALASTQPLASSFVQAVNTIESYCKMTVAQSVADATLNASLQSVRTHAGTWYNNIYPVYLDMPSTINAAGSQINSDLNMLISLATQMGSGTNPQIEQQISLYSNNLTGTLQNLAGQVSALVTTLQSFTSNLSADAGTLNNDLNSINGNLCSLNQQLAGFYGKLHSLQSATCPSKSNINACQNLISSTQSSISSYNSALSVFQQVASAIGGAINGAGFLANFWESFVADIQACITALANIANETGSILQTDLQCNQTNWTAMQTNLQAISQQINT